MGGRGACGGAHTSGREKKVRKGCERVKIVQILCIQVCKWKTKTC
jgi:hypothetical protein